jgi:hypothetical protein
MQYVTCESYRHWQKETRTSIKKTAFLARFLVLAVASRKKITFCEPTRRLGAKEEHFADFFPMTFLADFLLFT